MKWVLSLYPPGWQRRFRAEMEQHLQESGARGWRTRLDLLAGAIDAWANQDLIPASPAAITGGTIMEFIRCGACHERISRADSLRSAAWMIGLSLAQVIPLVALDKIYGDSVFTQAGLYAAFFVALIVSSRGTYLKPYTPFARNLITVGGILLSYAFFLGVVLLGARI